MLAAPAPAGRPTADAMDGTTTSDGWTTAGETGRRATAAVPAGLAGRPMGIGRGAAFGLSYLILVTETLFQPQRTSGL